MIIQKLLKILPIFMLLVVDISQAEEEIFYPSSIKKLKKEIGGGGENPLPSAHLRELCRQEYLNISNQITREDLIKDGEITIFNNVNLTKEEKKFLKSNWSGSIIFSDQELENIKAIMDE